MKIFIYKTLIVLVASYLLFQFTIGQILKSYESKVENYLYNKQGRQEILNKIKDEIKSANQKESIFTLEEREILSKFINKIRKELNVNEPEK
mgnify:FL=1|jgi:ubiquinone biosynthesis protein Coq4|tara:strand:+ start:221 stop:496 length:276 start_codon:yes stop_codon:yes gene_type:complete